MGEIQQGTHTRDKNHHRLLELLKERQNRFGYLSEESLVEVAESLGLAVSEVYGVATFYAFLGSGPKGRHVIRICKSVPCFLKYSDTIVESIEKELGIKPGETTADGRFTLELTNCIGACDKAPAMMIDHDIHGELDRDKIVQILKSYK